MEEIAREYITVARQLSSSGCYSKAFDLYVLSFDKNPRLKNLFEPEFRSILIKLNEVLATANKIEDIFSNFGRAIDAFPNNVHLLNDIGKYLYKFGFYAEAWCHFHRALKLDNGFVNPEKNLNSVKNLLMERWHFRMLNDKTRNDAYRDAIHATAVPFRDCILDIGTGTGLLAMYACECSPRTITACDGSAVMTSLAEVITQENYRQEIIIINKMSTSMNYHDVGGRRTLVVTEMFDAGLFGEHVLQTLAHAHECLMSNSAKVIPNKAEFFIAPVKCDYLNRRYQLCSTTKSILNIPHYTVHILTFDETYDCEDVHLYRDIKYMAEPLSLLKVNFNDYQDVYTTLNRNDPYTLQFKVKEDGEINAVIGWFNLYLTDNITITTDPRSDKRANAWQQAVFFDNIPKTVTQGELVDFHFLLNRGKLTMLPNWNSEVLRISPETLRYLNDTEFVNMIKGSIAMTCIYLGQIADISLTNIVDLCPFPLFGLLMLRRGAQSLICCAKTDVDRVFFETVFEANNVPLSKLHILVGDEWGQEVFRDEKYHAIFCNIFDLWGDVELRNMEIAQHLKQSHLLQGGLFMPSNVKVMGQLINSHWLDINNRVYDENVSNFKMAKHVNKYQVSQNFCIDFSHLEYTPLSEPVVLGVCSTDTRSHVVNVPVVNNGYLNAILCWYSLELMEHLGEISTNRKNSFIDGTVFLISPKVPMISGKFATVLHCVDPDGSFKLMIDVDTT
ncbi:protein arginine N-methyltransferase 9-like [Galleria mellonella]|uniref:Protein arginine N-methyltransferase 9-like n=1 Tax=Galleria mellonella TaxID=7137 RepID=A0A6J1X3W5_GALME|nr:protein arginine N-methyltransferase 9-like [Galleria mellonella]